MAQLKTVLTQQLLGSINCAMRINDTNGEGAAAFREGRVWRMLIAGRNLMQVGVLAAGLLTLLACVSWIADLLANLRMQLVVAGVVATAVALLSKQWKTLLVQLLLLSLHTSWIILPARRAEVGVGLADITVTSINAYIHNDQHAMIAARLSDLSADVITVTELSPALYEQLMVVFATSHPFAAAQPQSGSFGVGIFSKYPLSDIAMIGTDTTGKSLLATVQLRDQNYRVVAVHPYSPMTPWRFDLRNQHFKALSQAVQTVHQRQPETLCIVMGDFNSTPWSPHFRRFQRASGLYHVAQGSGVTPTWYAPGPTMFPFGLVLDHCMVSPRLACISCCIGPSVGSDHLPLTVQLSLRR